MLLSDVPDGIPEQILRPRRRLALNRHNSDGPFQGFQGFLLTLY
jgi:hypothetical protein